MNAYLVTFMLPVILSRIIPLTPFPVSWEDFTEDMFLIVCNHTGQQGSWQVAINNIDRNLECNGFRLPVLLDAILMH